MSLDRKKIRNVLILMPDKHMGNLVVSLPAIKALRDFFFGKGVYLLIDAAYEDIVNALDGLDNVLLLPRKELNELNFSGRFSLFFKFLKRLRAIRPDIAVDLQGGYASAIFTFLSGASLRVGRSTAERPYVYNLKVDLTREKHKVYSYTEIAAAVGAKSELVSYRLRASDKQMSSLKGILLEEGITTEKPIICIHPGAGKLYKQWTKEGFTEISDWFSSEGFQAVFVGGEDESEEVEEIRSHTKRHIYNLSGKLTLGELMALLEISSLYIGNDSGPMHLAAATGAPVIGLFGPADEKRWGPISENSIILRGDRPCDKCKGKDCEMNFRCIKTLSSEKVKSAAGDILTKGEGVIR